MVSVPHAGDVVGDTVDHDRAVHLHVLFVGRRAWIGSVHRADPDLDQVHVHLHLGVAPERLARIDELPAVAEADRTTLERGAEALARLEDVEPEAIGVEDSARSVRGPPDDARTVRHQDHVGKLGHAFVDPIAQTKETAGVVRAVVPGEHHALVVLLLAFVDRVHGFFSWIGDASAQCFHVLSF